MTVHGRAVIERELERIAVVRVDVDSIQDHSSPRFEIDAGVQWHWTSDEAAQGDACVRPEAALLVKVRAAVFDFGETLLSEERAWGVWADWVGVSKPGAVRRDRRPHR